VSQSTETVVETKAGRIEGTKRDGLYIFRGIPYAAAPVGHRRWLGVYLTRQPRWGTDAGSPLSRLSYGAACAKQSPSGVLPLRIWSNPIFSNYSTCRNLRVKIAFI